MVTVRIIRGWSQWYKFRPAWVLGCIQNYSNVNFYFQACSLGLFRSDYFFCCLHQGIKQVEFNTIASSFGAISSTLVQAQKSVRMMLNYFIVNSTTFFLNRYVLSELNRRDLLPQVSVTYEVSFCFCVSVSWWKSKMFSRTRSYQVDLKPESWSCQVSR